MTPKPIQPTARPIRAAALLAAALLGACATAAADPGAPRIVQPGLPGETGRVVGAQAAAGGAQRRYTEADVRFMQGMIHHHVQALAMVGLVPERSSRQDVRLLARRIELSQDDEIRLMQKWLADRGEAVPAVPDAPDRHGGHAPGAGPEEEASPLMPGMLTAAEMARLEAATGAAFDRLFLSAMIHHHEGALIMVAELFSHPGAAQDAEIFQFASHVDSDQSAEIARMRRMLNAGPAGDRFTTAGAVAPHRGGRGPAGDPIFKEVSR